MLSRLALQTSRSLRTQQRCFGTTAPSLRKILVALDSTPGSELAFKRASSIADKHDYLLLFTCAPPIHSEFAKIVMDFDKIDNTVQDAFIQEMQEHSTAIANAVKAKFNPMTDSLKCSFDWVEGCSSNGPRGEIVRMAEEENVDLVVLGSHGHDSTLERVMLGSTADYVVHHVHCDVMICKKPRKKE